jgi:hypothetical protein
MRGVSDHAESVRFSRHEPSGVAFRQVHGVGTPIERFRGSIPGLCGSPVNACQATLRSTSHDSGPVEALPPWTVRDLHPLYRAGFHRRIGLSLRRLLRRSPTAGPGLIATDAPSCGQIVLSGSRVSPRGRTVPASRRGCAGDAQGMRYPPATPPPGVSDRQNAPATRRRTPRAELSWPDRPITRTGPGSHTRTAARAVARPDSADRERKRKSWMISGCILAASLHRAPHP